MNDRAKLNAATAAALLFFHCAAWAAVYPAGGLTTAQTATLFGELMLSWFGGYWVGARIRMVRQTVEVA